MLENQLFLAVVLKQHGIFIKRTYFACEFDSADQVYRDRSLIFADRVEKRVLNVLCRLIVHVPISISNVIKVRYGKVLKCFAVTANLSAEPKLRSNAARESLHALPGQPTTPAQNSAKRRKNTPALARMQDVPSQVTK